MICEPLPLPHLTPTKSTALSSRRTLRRVLLVISLPQPPRFSASSFACWLRAAEVQRHLVDLVSGYIKLLLFDWPRGRTGSTLASSSLDPSTPVCRAPVVDAIRYSLAHRSAKRAPSYLVYSSSPSHHQLESHSYAQTHHFCLLSAALPRSLAASRSPVRALVLVGSAHCSIPLARSVFHLHLPLHPRPVRH